MPNTTIQLKKSGTASNTPSSLAYGELAINYADGKLFYKAANGVVVPFASGTISFGTINANGTLVVADSPGAIVSFLSGNNISVLGDAVNDRITINADISPAYNAANTAQYTANLAFDRANTGGGGYFQGSNGDKGSANYGDIFRSHANTLTGNVTILSGNNSIAAGPITVQTGKTLTIQTGARVAIV